MQSEYMLYDGSSNADWYRRIVYLLLQVEQIVPFELVSQYT